MNPGADELLFADIAANAPLIIALTGAVTGGAAIWRSRQSDRNAAASVAKAERQAADSVSVSSFEAVNKERKEMMDRMQLELAALRIEVAKCEAHRDSLLLELADMRFELTLLRRQTGDT